jgi:hypothetical protein
MTSLYKTQCLDYRFAVELAPLRVNAVSPGVIDTGWWDFLDAEARQQAFADFAAVTVFGLVRPPILGRREGFVGGRR